MRGRFSRLSSRAVEYLLSILERSRDKGYARQYEIVEDLGVSKPTASLMVRKLREAGYLEVRGEKIMLSRMGRELVLELIWRHGVIESALVRLGLSPERACRTAWRIIQDIPAEDVKRIWSGLGSPSSCPCGYPMPVPDKGVRIEEVETCTAFRSGRSAERP